ncbi:MAG TPA: tetratricopeptide repeat protein [Acidimicrobiales bacterium]|nr:tetratricopeptide repeat protein [Acidimicrobiales bacterium]
MASPDHNARCTIERLPRRGAPLSHGAGDPRRYRPDRRQSCPEACTCVHSAHDAEAAEPAGTAAGTVPAAGLSLPFSADAFIGRQLDLAGLEAALAESRLVVVTGPSGIGKTRLVREAGTRIAGRYPGGVHFVELAAIREPALVPRAIAAALSVWEQPGRPMLDVVVSHMRRRHLLVILDNCEHLIGECARVADVLLQACPKLLVLATSQIPFGIGGEEVWPLAPLSVPDEGASAELLAASDAVALFSLRAAATSAGFRLTPELVPVVAEICRRLDGIPLAVELAAARVAVLSPQEILDRLGNRFDLLTGGSRAVLPRHQTLQAAFDWSHDLLSDQEAVLLRRLSVFTGGCTLDAAEAVCAVDGDGREVLPALAGLVAKSLVLATTSGAQARYRMLETIRIYGGELLERSGQTATLRRRHAQWCVALVEKAEPELTGPDQVSWLDRLEEEHANLRDGLAWAVAEGDAEVALRLAGALTIFWRVHCHFREGREWLSAALALAAEGRDRPAARAKALWGLGFMDLMGRIDSAPAMLGECLALFRSEGDIGAEARTLFLLGNDAWMSADLESARRHLEPSVELARRCGDSWCLSHALACLGRTHLSRGDAGAARALLEESVEVARGTRDQQSLRFSLTFLGELDVDEGNYADAEAVLTEALAVSRLLGEPYNTAMNLLHLGRLATAGGDYDRAGDLLGAALELNRDGDAPTSLAFTLSCLGSLEHGRGQLENARAHFEEAQAVAAGAGARSTKALMGLAEVALGEGKWSEAEALLDEARSALPAEATSARAAVISGLGRLARARGDVSDATALCAEALALRNQAQEAPGLAASLEEMAALAGQTSQWDRSARLFGAALVLREAKGYARPPVLQSGYEADVATTEKTLGRMRFRALWQQGSSMSLPEAVAYALTDRNTRGGPNMGWIALTPAERGVTKLVGQGLTNREIGERLYISPRTVETHLTHIFGKLGLTSRRQLADEAQRRQM